MSKKLLILFLTIISAVCLVFGITACNKDENEDDGYYSGQTSPYDDSDEADNGDTGGDNDSSGQSSSDGESGSSGSDDSSDSSGGSQSSGGSGSSEDSGTEDSTGGESSDSGSGTEDSGSADIPDGETDIPDGDTDTPDEDTETPDVDTDTTGGDTESVNLQYIAEVKATCTADGNIAYWYDADNDKYYLDAEGTFEIIQEETILSATGHDYDFENIEEVWSGDYASAVAMLTCKNDSAHKVAVEASISSEVIKQATCSQEGKITYTATIIFDNEKYYVSETVITQKTEHSITHYEETEATCTEDGNIEYWYCADCGKYYLYEDCSAEVSKTDIVIAAGGHSIDGWSVTEPTSDSTGEAARECSICGYVYTISLPALDEINYTYEVVSYATHTEDGSATYTYNLYEDIVITVTLPAYSDEHVWDDGVVTAAATCTSTGVMTYTCTTCGYTRTEIIAATGHDYSITWRWNYELAVAIFLCANDSSHIDYIVAAVTSEVTKMSTCTDTGIKTYTATVTFNGETYYDTTTEKIVATGHTAAEAVTENYVAATCTTNGSYDLVVYCSVCGAEISRETIIIPSINHDYECVVTAPTCTEQGYTTHTCSVCGDTYTDNHVDATGHSWNEGEVTTEPTCTETGVKTYACTICDKTKTETIEAKGHTEAEAVKENEIAATCTEDGLYDLVVYCSVCGAEISRETITIPSTGHTVSTYTHDNSYHYYICSVCSETITDEHVFENGVCTTCGYEADYSVGLAYTLSDDGSYYTVSGIGTCTDTEIIIPSTYKNIDVTAIGAGAFSKCTSLTAVNIPDSVTTIGNSAFSNCTSLTAVAMSDGVTTIGSSAFNNCSSLTAVIIPDEVTSIGSYAFDNCTALTSINIPANVTSIGRSAFDGCIALTEIYFNATAMEDLSSSNYVFCSAGQNGGGIAVTIGSNVTNIPAYLFYPSNYSGYKPNILSVKFDADSECTSIGTYAFYNCTSLISVSIPENVSSIGNRAFYGCDKLIEVYNLSSLGITAGSSGNGYVAYYAKNIYTASGDSKLIYSGDYVFYNDDGTYYLVAYVGTETDISLPESINDNNYSIYNYAFYDSVLVESVTVSAGVTSIGSYAFSGCTALTDMTITESVKSIDSYAFSGCTALTNITLSDSVTSIGSYAFNGCKAFTSIIIPDSVASISSYAFNGCTALTGIIIPDSVASIGIYAFNGCTTLTSITISDSISSIGSYAFYNTYYYNDASNWIDGVLYIGNCLIKADTGISGEYAIKEGTTIIASSAFYDCSSLESIDIPDSVIAIGSSAFYGCTSLTSLTIGSGVTYMGNSAFYNCTALAEINFNATAMEDLSSSNYVFYNAGNSGDGIALSIGANVTKIPAYMFYSKSSSNAAKIISLSFAENSQCASIGSYAFYNGISLTSLTIGSGVTSMGKYAFYGCTALTEINFNAIAMKDLTINDCVFYDAGNSGGGIMVTIGANVTNIPAYLFYSSNSYSPNIVSVKFEDKTNEELEESGASTTIGSDAFYNCDSITSLIIGNGVTTIKSYAFFGCTSLESVTIGSNVESIGVRAFSSCTALTSISVPDSVKSIENYAFYGCTKLESVDLGSGVESVGGYAFYNCTALKSIVIPDNVTYIEDYAFYNCSSLISVTIGGGVTSIGVSAFCGCDALTIINYNATAMEDLSSSPFSTAGQSGGGITVSIGANVKNIPAYLFNNSSYITSVEFAENSVCASVGSYAFYYCTSLASITIGSSVETIGNYAFHCTALKSIVIPDSVTSIGEHAFSGCVEVTSLAIGSGVTTIGDYAFFGCYALTEIYFNASKMEDLNSNTHVFGCIGQSGDGIAVTIGTASTKIPAYLFYVYTPSTSYDYAPDIISVSFEEDSQCESIGSYAFYGCDSITSVTIGNSVTSIGANAFYGCTALTEINYNATAMEDLSSSNYVFYNAGNSGGGIMVTIGANVTEIPAYLFSSVSKITGVEFAKGGACASIGNYAFYRCTALKSIVIPDSVTSIGDYAFYWCNSLDSIAIPDSVTEIGEYAFYYCTSLTSLTIGKGVTTIGTYAFYECKALTEINYNAKEASDLTENSFVFAFAGQGGNGVAVTIGANVTKIPDYLFYAYDDLTDLDSIPKIISVNFEGISAEENSTIKSIGAYVFCKCKDLVSVTMGNGWTSIGDYAFYNCYSIKSLTLGSSVTDIGSYAFAYCSSMLGITVPASVTSIGDNAFRYCYKLIEIYDMSTLEITAGSTDNGYLAYYAKNIYTESNGSKLIYSDNYGFYYDGDEYYLIDYAGTDTSITLPGSINGSGYSIYNYAFYNFTFIEDISLPDTGIISIGRCAFENTGYYNNTDNWDSKVLYIGSYLIGVESTNTNIMSFTGDYTIKEGTTYIASYAFYNCVLLTSITLPSTVTYIGDYAFYYCYNCTSINIPSNVTYIGEHAFNYCYSITSYVVIPSGITDIKAYTFASCSGISIVIPVSVTSVESTAFALSSYLTVYYTGTASEWSELSISLNSATIYYYAENNGTTSDVGNYWYYDESGNIVTWVIEDTSGETA